jgi:hypothetical protein
MESTIMKNIIRVGAILLLGAAPFLRADMSFQVTVDTSPLASVAGYMAFDLFGGSPLQDNVATITSFATTGALGAAPPPSGDVSGSLVPGPLVETADQFFNEWLQPITFGSGLTTFDLDVTTSYIAGSTPDSFSFTLLDNTFTPFPTSDSTGADRLFAIDLVGADTTPDVFTSTFATATVTPRGSGGAVPEPNLLPFAFLGFGLMLSVHAMVRRARIARS